MKVSEITDRELACYLRLDYPNLTEEEKTDLNTMLSAVKAYILSYTGLTPEAMDTHQDIVIVVYVLVQDMYDNRALYVENKNMNKVVETILGMYCTNLL